MGWWLCLLLLITCQLNCSLSSSNSSSSPPPSRHLCNSDESSALLQFKNSFSIHPAESRLPEFIIPKTNSWTKDEDCCTWRGVTCERVTGHVTGLNLRFGGLQGMLPSNSSLFSLSHLKKLDLSCNDFMRSSISSKFGGFASMTHLHLVQSNFAGRIPPEISHLSKLVILALSSGSFSFMPLEKMTIDRLSMKRIAQNLTTLQLLSLYHFDMSSVVSDSFLNLSSSLISLSLPNCNLRGKFPETLFHLPNLEYLDLGQNINLTGSTPKSNWSSPLNSLELSSTKISIDLHFLTSNLKSLRFLFLSGCNFVGSHLEFSGNLTQLIKLDLSGNSFGGQIPWWSLLNLERLVSLDLSNNTFVGELPEIHSNSTKTNSSLHDLGMLSLNNNLLKGKIPSWVYSLPSLESLKLSHNQFSGNIKAFQSLSLSELYISSNNLSGVVELEKFRNLQSLRYLDISHNPRMVSFQNFSNYTLPNLRSLSMSSCHITQLPYFLSTSPQLTFLDLSDNQIQGNVPTWLLDVGIDSLSYCNLSHNFLTGTIEQFMWKNIRFLDLRSNLLKGKLPIPSPSISFFSMSNNQLTRALPSTLCNLTSLTVIDLSTNSLSGKIPQCIGTFSRSLSVLDLHMNQFLGKIPSTFPKGNILRNLNLRGNQLEGPLPQSLINCRKMEVLDLGDNKINDTFPNWLESLPLLQVLVLRSNRLYGAIGNPKTKFPFQKLRIMDLSHNQFGGPLPTKYFQNLMAMTNVQDEELKYMGESYYQDSVIVIIKGRYIELVKIQTMFTTIDFSNNAFGGEIPRVIGEPKSLKGLNFSSNKLTGPIPSAFGNLTNLEWLDISSNMLAGEIPRQLVNLTSLSKLNLSRNQLVGPIPLGNQFQTFENDSYSGNLGLCGYPLSKTCISDEPHDPPQPSFIPQDDDVNGIDWRVVLMGYGCGLVIGLSLGYIVFSIGKVDWRIREMGREIRSKMAKRTKKSVRTRN